MTMNAELQSRIRGQLKRLLHDGVVKVEFTKHDKSYRVMNCTLNAEQIGDDALPTSGAPDNKDILDVFDLDIEQWRSFRIDRLVQFSVVIKDQPYDA